MEQKLRKLKKVVIREELYAITNDTMEAILLGQLIYWQERVNDIDKYISEEKVRCANDGTEFIDNSLNGWIYKTSKQLLEECMLNISEVTVRRYLQKLIDSKYILCRNNPNHKWDKTLQYRVNLPFIIKSIKNLGYDGLSGYSLSKLQNEDSYNQNEAAIPKTITKDYNTNTKKEDTKVSKKENVKFDFKESLLDMGIDEQVVLDWMVVRKNKKASNTETAFKSIKKQIELTNASPNECIKMAVENSWQGFKAKWYLNEINSIGSLSNVGANNDQYKSDNEDYSKFRNWMKANCPSCDDPNNFTESRITEQEFLKLKEIYSGKDIADIIMAIENRKDLRGKYASLYITVDAWLKKRKQ